MNSKLMLELLRQEKYSELAYALKHNIDIEEKRKDEFRQWRKMRVNQLCELFSKCTNQEIEDLVKTFMLDHKDIRRIGYAKHIGECCYNHDRGYFTPQKIAATLKFKVLNK